MLEFIILAVTAVFTIGFVIEFLNDGFRDIGKEVGIIALILWFIVILFPNPEYEEVILPEVFNKHINGTIKTYFVDGDQIKLWDQALVHPDSFVVIKYIPDMDNLVSITANVKYELKKK